MNLTGFSVKALAGRPPSRPGPSGYAHVVSVEKVSSPFTDGPIVSVEPGLGKQNRGFREHRPDLFYRLVKCRTSVIVRDNPRTEDLSES